MAWVQKNRIALIAYAIFFAPAVIIPAFVHQQMPMRGWVYFAWLFCMPTAAVVGNIGKRRTLRFWCGLVAVLIPVELVWYLAYSSCFSNPDRKTIAVIYIPLITLVSFVCIPVGAVLTYQATRSSLSRPPRS